MSSVVPGIFIAGCIFLAVLCAIALLAYVIGEGMEDDET